MNYFCIIFRIMLKSEGKHIAENRHLPWAALQCDLSARLDFISRSIYNSTPHWVLTGIYSLLSRFSTSVWCNVNGSYWFTEDWITVWWVRCCRYYAVSDDNTVDWESYRSQCLQDQSFRGFAQSAVSQTWQEDTQFTACNVNHSLLLTFASSLA